jgi:hypothetical protein
MGMINLSVVPGYPRSRLAERLPPTGLPCRGDDQVVRGNPWLLGWRRPTGKTRKWRVD